MSKTVKAVGTSHAASRPSSRTASTTPSKSTTVTTAKKTETGSATRKVEKSMAPASAKAPPRKGAAKRTATEIAAIFARFAAAMPEPKGELEHSNPFTLLVAVVLSAQATDAGVNKATRALFACADTPQKMLDLGEDVVRDHVKTIGLFRNKAKNVIALSQQLLRDHNGEVPAERDALTALPGVGRKTANVVLNMAFGHKTMAVDTHVFRVAHRLDMSLGNTPEAVEDDLMRIIPDAYLFHAHHWLILHGRYTCVARAPKCATCPVADLCRSVDKSLPA